MEAKYRTLCDKLSETLEFIKLDKVDITSSELILKNITSVRIYLIENYDELQQPERDEISFKLNLIDNLYQDQMERGRLESLKELQKQLKKY